MAKSISSENQRVSYVGIDVGRKTLLKPRNNTIEKLDGAFRWLVILLTLSFSTLFGWLGWFWKEEKDPIIMSIRYFFFPIVVVVLCWILQIVTEDENRKMLLRKMTWFWSIFQFWIHLCIWIVFYSMNLGELLMNSAMLAGILCSIPFYLLYRKVINSYRMSQCEISFWREKRWNYGATILSGSIILLYILLLVFLYSLEHPELWNYSA